MKTCTQFLEKNSSAIFVVDRHSRIVFANTRAATLTKKKPEELVGKHFFDIVSAKELTVALEDVQLLPEGTLLYCSDKTMEASYALMVHQLKSPLATIRWMCELLLQRRSISGDDRKALREVYVANQRVIGIVNDLLQLAKFETGNIDVSCTPHALPELIASVVRLLTPQSEAKGQKIVVRDEGAAQPASLDEELFTAAFTNLLDNAIIYGDPNSTVTVEVRRGSHGKHYIVSVHDVGVVIAPEESSQLFAKFYRGEAAKRIKPSGSGLGLHIARIAVEACGGTMSVASSAAEGTTFSFTVPIAQQAEAR